MRPGITRRLGIGVVAAAALALGAPTASGQHGGAGAHTGHAVAQRCATEFEQVIGEGRGFGLAFAADRNGYPGPQHVLELRQHLRLTPAQEQRAQALLEAMLAEAKPKSARLLEAERHLRRLFAAGGADEAAVRAAAAEVERARTDVRLVHLLTHLKTRDVLTAEQRAAYHRARWEVTPPPAEGVERR